MCVDNSRFQGRLAVCTAPQRHHSTGPASLMALLAKAWTPPVKKACPLAAVMNLFAAQLAPEPTLLPPATEEASQAANRTAR